MRIIRARDVIDAMVIIGFLPVAWFLPAGCRRRVAGWAGRAHVRLLGMKGDHLKTVLRDCLGVDQHDIEIGFRQHNYLELMEILREHAPWGWHPRITIIGRQYIDEALAAGKGAVLWYTPFTHADIVFKKGLHQAGYRISHLSSLTHGFSDTRFGVALLNPLKTRVEGRYLKERCVMGGTGVGLVIRSLLDRLRRNEVVSVTALQTGKRTGQRMLLGGTIHLAKGAPNFAATTGAALIPVFVVPAEDGYEVRVEPPLAGSGTDVESVEEAYISAYVPILQRYVSQYPLLWRGWLGPSSYWSPGVPATRSEPDRARELAHHGR